MPRTVRPTRDAAVICLRQWARIADAVEGLADRAFDIVTPLPGWRVRDLIIHCVNRLQVLPAALGSRASLDVAGFLSAMPCQADESDGGSATPEQLRTLIRAASQRFARWAENADMEAVVDAEAGPIRAADFLVARCIEGVVHALDLAVAASTPQPDAGAVKVTVRGLLDVLATKAPGRSVEVRVPPIAAVQCVEGPRHTRGTPPNVVEADPITWIELAAGRLAWRDATDDGRVRASGERSDLRPLLPLLPR